MRKEKCYVYIQINCVSLITTIHIKAPKVRQHNMEQKMTHHLIAQYETQLSAKMNIIICIIKHTLMI